MEIQVVQITSYLIPQLIYGVLLIWNFSFSLSLDITIDCVIPDNVVRMTDALPTGAQQDQHCINAEIILAAANNQSLT